MGTREGLRDGRHEGMWGGFHGHGWLPSPALALAPDPLSPLQVGKLRERLQEAKLEREQEQRRHTAYLSALRAKLHEEKTKELQALRESLIRQHEQEAARTAKIKDGELQRLQATLNVLRDGAADKVKTALLAEAREEARRSFDGERLRLQQEVLEQKAARKQAEEALSHCVQADKAKAADLRAAYQEHQDEVHRIKRECERDIRRLVRESATRPAGTRAVPPSRLQAVSTGLPAEAPLPWGGKEALPAGPFLTRRGPWRVTQLPASSSAWTGWEPSVSPAPPAGLTPALSFLPAHPLIPCCVGLFCV